MLTGMLLSSIDSCLSTDGYRDDGLRSVQGPLVPIYLVTERAASSFYLEGHRVSILRQGKGGSDLVWLQLVGKC